MLNAAYCRLCAEIKPCSNLSVIKNEDEYSKNLCYQILQCFQVQISDDDNLPKTICLDCCTQTSVTYEFFNKVQRAQEFLRNVVYKSLINNSTPINFIQPAVGFVSNENNIDDLIKTRVESDTDAEQDVKHSDDDDFRDNESSRFFPNVQSSSTSKILDKNNKKIDKQSQKDEVKVEIKSEINNYEISGLQSDDANRVQSTEKNKVIRKRKRNNKKIRESKSKICKDEGNQEICEELKDYTWSCSVCLDKLTTRQDLIEHFQQKHNKPVEYSCTECPRTISTYEVFVQHVQRHRTLPKFCCEECGKEFNTNRYLTQHLNYVHGRIQFKCDVCDKIYKRMSGLKNHKKSHLPNNPEMERKFPCRICQEKFLTEKRLIKHEKIHDKLNKRFTCEKCGSRFKTISNLKVHFESVHIEYSEDQYVQCPLCPTKLKHKRQLARHRRLIHFPTKIYTCETCGKKFNRQTLYQKHRMIHTGERPFKCEHCDKSFRIKTHLQVHNRQHTGEKPYCCSECKHYFTDLSNYIKHMSKKHGVTSFKNVKKITDAKPGIQKEN